MIINNYIIDIIVNDFISINKKNYIYSYRIISYISCNISINIIIRYKISYIYNILYKINKSYLYKIIDYFPLL
jgi:hypothetical protein